MGTDDDEQCGENEKDPYRRKQSSCWGQISIREKLSSLVLTMYSFSEYWTGNTQRMLSE